MEGKLIKTAWLAVLLVLVFSSASYSIPMPEAAISMKDTMTSGGMLSGFETDVEINFPVAEDLQAGVQFGTLSRDFDCTGDLKFAQSLKSQKIGVKIRKFLLKEDTGSLYFEMAANASSNILKRDSLSYELDGTDYFYNFATGPSLEYIVGLGITADIGSAEYGMSLGYSVSTVPLSGSKTAASVSGVSLSSTENFDYLLTDNKLVVTFDVKL